MSFVRAYSKHEASYIFRVKDLDLAGVAKSFGLLRLPRMPELKGADTGDWIDAEVDVSVPCIIDGSNAQKQVPSVTVVRLRLRG